MATVIYNIVEHDGGWAYEMNGTYSESFPTHDDAFAAARQAATEQKQPGETTRISWEDERGRWHAEISQGDDRPESRVEP